MKNIKIHFINSFFDFDHFINSFFDFDFEFYSSFNLNSFYNLKSLEDTVCPDNHYSSWTLINYGRGFKIKYV